VIIEYPVAIENAGGVFSVSYRVFFLLNLIIFFIFHTLHIDNVYK
jgi:hypothetical protein